MKYNENNKPLVCMQTNSTCYKGTTTMVPKGVLWHSTGANNPYIKRYVQPLETDANYDEMIAILGKNKYGNDWNHKERQAGLNCWIGKLANDTVATIQTMPWNYKPWGCGAGSKGSLNNTHMQFEICEDDLNSKEYFEAVYKEACEITAYYCKLYNLDPLGTFVYNGVTVPVITTHDESYDLKLGSNHGDPISWFKKYGKTMDDARKDVAVLMKSIDSKPDTPKKETNEVMYYVQVGAYSELKNANNMVAKLKAAGFNACIKTDKNEANTEKKWEPAIGDVVKFTGYKQYSSSNSDTTRGAIAGIARITAIAKGKKHPYHLIRTGNSGPYGWVDEGTFVKV